VEETGVPEETTDLTQVTDKLYHLVVIGTDCTYNHDYNHDHAINISIKDEHVVIMQ
jgi:hypothetical protein